MTVYKGRWEAIRGPLVVLAILAALVLTIYLFVAPGFFKYFFMVLLLVFVPLLYSGLVLKITIDDKKMVVVRPLTRVSVRFEDVALCAVHAIEDEKHLIYAFVKEKRRGVYTVKGVRPKLPFEEVVKMAEKEEDYVDLDVNFSRAKKLPVSFVENGEELKDRFLKEVGKYHIKVMEEK
jgi:hypothetical protein